MSISISYDADLVLKCIACYMDLPQLGPFGLSMNFHDCLIFFLVEGIYMFLSSRALAFAGGLLSLCTLYSALSPPGPECNHIRTKVWKRHQRKIKTVIHVVVSY